MLGDLFFFLEYHRLECWLLVFGAFSLASNIRILILLLLFGPGWSRPPQLHCHQIRLSPKTEVKAERDVSLKVTRIKFQLPVGRVSCFGSLEVSQSLLPQEAQI